MAFSIRDRWADLKGLADPKYLKELALALVTFVIICALAMLILAVTNANSFEAAKLIIPAILEGYWLVGLVWFIIFALLNTKNILSNVFHVVGLIFFLGYLIISIKQEAIYGLLDNTYKLVTLDGILPALVASIVVLILLAAVMRVLIWRKSYIELEAQKKQGPGA